MPYLGVADVDDFLATVLSKEIKLTWQDISMELQDYVFASRLFSKAKPDEMAGDMLKWRIQIANNETFKFTGQFADDTTVRQNLMTHGSIGWSQSTANYVYDITDSEFRKSYVEIVKYMDVLEHSLYNAYFKGMELAMMGNGPTSPTQETPPPCSLTWWIQPYSTSHTDGLSNGNGQNTGAYALGTGVTNDFLGMDPYGFSAVGTGNVLSTTHKGWRNRVGVYSVFDHNDAVKTIVECLDKCDFKAPRTYAATVPEDRPKWEMLTTYSRIQLGRDMLQAGNDNIKSDLATYMDTVLIRGIPLRNVPAWNNQDFGAARTDGLVLGVNWANFKYYSATGLRMELRPPHMIPGKHTGRMRCLDDSGQVVCLNKRTNFAVTSSVAITEHN